MRLDAALDETERRLSARDTKAWGALIERMVAECHPEQRDFVVDPARYIVALVGRGGGKTTGGDVRFVRRMLSTPGARCLFVARTRDHAKRLIWEDTKKMFKRLGFLEGADIVYNESDLIATIVRNDASLRLVGADKMHYLEPLRGLTWHEIGIDEAASHPDKILSYLIDEVAGPRLLGSLWLIGTAGKRLKGRFYDVSRRGSTESRPYSLRDAHPGWLKWSSHRWSLKSAIEATRERPIAKLVELYAAQQLELLSKSYSDDNPIKRREYDAEWASDETINVYRYRIHDEDGAIWNQWDPVRVGPMAIAQLPAHLDNWVHVIAIDPGYTDPTAINVFAISLNDPSRTIYHRLCFEQTGLYARPLAHLLVGTELRLDAPGGIIGAIGEWPNAMVADPAHQMAQATLAELLNVYSINIEPAQKGFRYKVGAIDVVNGDLVDGRIKILKDSLLEEQLIDLQWDESRTGEQIERKGQPNHSADCLVYARAALGEFITAVAPPPTEQPKPDPRAPGYVPPFPEAPTPEDEYLIADYADTGMFG